MSDAMLEKVLAQLDAAIACREVRIHWPGQSIAELQNARDLLVRLGSTHGEPLAAALRDAERYRHLRQFGVAGFALYTQHVLDDTVDAAIDAATKEPR